MDTTAMILHKKYKKQSKDNKKAATAIKELLDQEQTQIRQQYTRTKQQIHLILQHNQIITTNKHKTKEHQPPQAHTKQQQKNYHISSPETNSQRNAKSSNTTLTQNKNTTL